MEFAGKQSEGGSSNMTLKNRKEEGNQLENIISPY